jgi:hypothetical protein
MSLYDNQQYLAKPITRITIKSIIRPKLAHVRFEPNEESFEITPVKLGQHMIIEGVRGDWSKVKVHVTRTFMLEGWVKLSCADYSFEKMGDK